MRLRLPLVFLCTVSCAFAVGRTNAPPVRLDPGAFEFAQQLIRQGRFVADGKGSWAMHHPNRAAENEFIRVHGFSEYAKWHLGIDERHSESTKARYKFPYGDFENIHRCGLLAAKSRAREFGYSAIEDSVAKLIEMINSKKPKP